MTEPPLCLLTFPLPLGVIPQTSKQIPPQLGNDSKHGTVGRGETSILTPLLQRAPTNLLPPETMVTGTLNQNPIGSIWMLQKDLNFAHGAARSWPNSVQPEQSEIVPRGKILTWELLGVQHYSHLSSGVLSAPKGSLRKWGHQSTPQPSQL